jgi:Sulfotransferase family
MTMPNFLIIGTAKSGTTALYNYLKQHPQVYMSPVKEPKFFAYEGEKLDFRGPGDRVANSSVVTDIEAYRALFAKASGETAVGEASPLYLYIPKARERISRYVPEAKLIAILRNPAERAYSHFSQMVRDGREPLDDFSQALGAEEGRVRDNWAFGWHYKRMGFYHAQLERYFDAFGRDQIKVYLYEDLKTDPVGVLRETFRFLDVDDAFVPDMSLKHNVSGIPKSRALHAFIRQSHPIKSVFKPFVPEQLRLRLKTSLRNRNLRQPPPLSREARKELAEAYREDILKLQGLIRRDLSTWLR